MDTVLIVCGAGASSTFLALRLRKALRARELELLVEAAAQPDLDERLETTSILLVGPHLDTQFDELNARAARVGARAALLPDTVFGPEGAEAAADLVSELLAESRGSRTSLKAEPIRGE